MTEDFNLTTAERMSPLWSKLEKYLHGRLEVCRRKNDADLTEGETARLRGRIQALKELLVLGEIPPQVEADSATDPQ